MLPFLVWTVQSSTIVNVWILDKTVPYPDYREHKGLVWVLNHFKMIPPPGQTKSKHYQYDTDYYGFFPGEDGKYRMKGLPQDGEKPDLIYIADTYGVYQADYLSADYLGSRSSKIYGGLNKADLFTIQNNLEDNILIAEFNSMASPTELDSRKVLEEMVGVRWAEWMGRYFEDLSIGNEIPDWMVINYEKKYKKSWEFAEAGYVLVSDDDQIIVLEMKKDVGNKGLRFSFEPNYEKEFNNQHSVPYYYWFEWIQPMEDTELIASYHLDLTESGKKKLESKGLSFDFPAITRCHKDNYIAYYFAGDFADNNKIPRWYQYKGFPTFKRYVNIDIKGNPQGFFWRAYVPLMQNILEDVQEKL